MTARTERSGLTIWHTWALVFCTCTLMGCGHGQIGNLATVEGTITQDGQPLADAEVTFLPDPSSGTRGPRSMARTDASGHYRLRTDGGDPGAVVGQHQVRIRLTFPRQRRLPRSEDGEKGREPRTERSLSAEKPVEKTLPNVEVHAGAQTLDFDVAYSVEAK
jgi:hypothetical protein